MKQIKSASKMNNILIPGMLGCLLMGGSDWLMIYGDTAYSGNLAWLTAGAAQISGQRNALAMLLAFPAVALYSIALFGIRPMIPQEKPRRIYSALTALGLTQWISLHLLYVMILFLFGWMQQNGYAEASFAACEALFRQFAWIIPLGEAIMLLPFLYLMWTAARGRTVYPKWMALNSPLLIYIVLKVLTMLMPDCAFRLAFTNGLMSESMLIWFAVFLFAWPKYAREAQR